MITLRRSGCQALQGQSNGNRILKIKSHGKLEYTFMIIINVVYSRPSLSLNTIHLYSIIIFHKYLITYNQARSEFTLRKHVSQFGQRLQLVYVRQVALVIKLISVL